MGKITLNTLILFLISTNAFAADNEFTITIKEHKFNPPVLEIPADQKVKLIVHNDDATPEEFESFSLRREKVITGNSKGIIFIGPLSPGEYEYFGEFNQDTAKGKIVVK